MQQEQTILTFILTGVGSWLKYNAFATTVVSYSIYTGICPLTCLKAPLYCQFGLQTAVGKTENTSKVDVLSFCPLVHLPLFYSSNNQSHLLAFILSFPLSYVKLDPPPFFSSSSSLLHPYSSFSSRSICQALLHLPHPDINSLFHSQGTHYSIHRDMIR